MLDRTIPLLAMALLGGCADGLCGNDVLHTAISPGGRHAAIVFERDCGATTGFSFQVSILAPGEMPSGAGNIYISTPSRTASDNSRVPPVEIIWLGPNRLRIRYRESDEIIRRLGEWQGVRIEYRASAAGN